MRLARLVITSLLCLSLAACACKTKRVVGDGVPLAEEGLILDDINFAFDRYDIDADGEMKLQGNAEWLTENSEAKVQIEGHCDKRGTVEYNYALGSKRAEAVRDYLRSLGIEADRMSTISYGEDLPLDTRDNEEAYSKNRRAHFRILE